MLCKDCPLRSSCSSPCSALKRELEKISKPQREQLFAPKILEAIYEVQTEKETGYSFSSLLDRLEVTELVNALPDSLRRIVYGRFWQGKSFVRLSRELGISRFLVYQGYFLALAQIRKELILRLQEGVIPFALVKFDYNKNARDEAKEEKNSKEEREETG